jgi:thiol-disulfide isomerase/thioredoxin
MIKALLVYSLFVPILLSMYGCNEGTDQAQERLELKKKSLQTKVGEKFVVGNIIDSSERLVQLDFTKSDITIIDFWFNECPPCIEEMKQFVTLLKGREKKITVISISINGYGLWKSILQKPVGRFSFLTNQVSNWEHYNLQSVEDESLKNIVPADSQEQLKSDLNITFYPAYFVVDRFGVILSRPVSAVDYIKAL